MQPSSARRRLLLAGAALVPAALLGGCGFQLRGPQPLPFSSIYVGADPNSELGAGLRRKIAASGATIIDDPATAEVRLEFLRNAREREILSLSSAGKVREYQLKQTVTFRLVNQAGTQLLAPTSISAQREYNFDDSRIIAKEQEEALLFRDMETDLMQQLLRRLAAIRS